MQTKIICEIPSYSVRMTLMKKSISTNVSDDVGTTEDTAGMRAREAG